MGMRVLTYDASAICKDPNLFLPEADSKDPVVPARHHRTPAIEYIWSNGSFSTVPRAMYETCIRGEYVAIPNLLDLVHIYEFL